jgi:TRAP-type C4-dicarboxylate transport system substrate-binding protein
LKSDLQLNNLEEKIQQTVGTKIRELRLALEFKSKDLALAAGISQSQLSKIEAGKAKISIKTLTQLCNILNRPLTYLFQTEENTPRVLGTLATIEGPEKLGFSHFADMLKEKTRGRMTLIPMKPSQLGSGADQVRILSEGVIDMFIEDLSHYNGFAPTLDFLSIPYSFQSYRHLQAFLSSSFFDEQVRRPLLAKNIRLLNTEWNWQRGIELVLVSRKVITSPQDVKGLRVRVPKEGLNAMFWRKMGCQPIVVPWQEVKAALAAKEIDVLPTHKAHLMPLGFCRYARYVTLLGGIPAAVGLAMNENKYQTLPPDVQNIVAETFMQASGHFTETVLTMETKNEVENIERNDAVYLKVNLLSWQTLAIKIRQELIAEGLLSQVVWDMISQLAPASHPLETS